MNKRYNDTDLREALHRKYANEPQLPADFMAKMEQRMADGSTVPSGSAAGAKRARLWRWVAAAACFLIILGVGLHYQFKEPVVTGDVTLGNTARYLRQQAPLPKVTSEPASEPLSAAQNSKPSKPIHAPSPVRTRRTETPLPTEKDSAPYGKTAASYDQNLHYTSNDLTKDTVPYQDPARVDDYIFQLAEHYQVKQGQLTCSLPVDSSVVSSVYVFPDKDDINLFNRLLQVACWYNSKTPGYHLNFSQQQFFFELKDMRRQLQYRWIAERINGRILFYSTQAPIGVKESSACYQQYRDELMYQNSINIKNKKI